MASRLRSLKVGRLTTVLALLAAGVAYRILKRFIDVLVCRLFDLRTLNAQDEFFMYDDKDSLSNTTVVMFMDKFEYDRMQKDLMLNLGNVPAVRLTLISVLGQYYFKNLTKD